MTPLWDIMLFSPANCSTFFAERDRSCSQLSRKLFPTAISKAILRQIKLHIFTQGSGKKISCHTHIYRYINVHNMYVCVCVFILFVGLFIYSLILIKCFNSHDVIFLCKCSILPLVKQIDFCVQNK